MAQIAIEELLRRCNSAYRLVILAAKRAKEVAEGGPSLVEPSHRKATSIALDEIRGGKVLYKALEGSEARVEKKGRSKAKGEKTKRVAA